MNPIERTDDDLVTAACDGDARAFEQLTERYRARLVNYAEMASGGAVDSEAVVQEALMRAYAARHKYRREAGFTAWLYTIVRNETLRAAGRNRKFGDMTGIRRVIPDRVPGNSENEPEEAILQQERMRAVRTALSRLPRLQREAILLTRYGEMSCGETARVLGTSDAAVRTAIYKGLKSLRKRLMEDG